MFLPPSWVKFLWHYFLFSKKYISNILCEYWIFILLSYFLWTRLIGLLHFDWHIDMGDILTKWSAQGHCEKHHFLRWGMKTIEIMVAKFFCILISAFQVKGYCSTRKCEKISFDQQQDASHGKELVGHVFHNSVTSNPQQCYLLCMNDCRCLSINYKVKNDIKYCELNEGSHFTNKNSLKNIHGSVYYVLRKEYTTKVLNFSIFLKFYFYFCIFAMHLCSLHLEIKGV